MMFRLVWRFIMLVLNEGRSIREWAGQQAPPDHPFD